MRSWTLEGPWSVFAVGSNVSNVTGMDADAFYAGGEVTCLGNTGFGTEVDHLMAHAY
jgi:hypothetical protein